MPTFEQLIRKKRLSFTADVLAKREGKKVHRVMWEEVVGKGEWWGKVEEDMDSYNIDSVEQLIELEMNNQLKEYLGPERVGQEGL